MVFIIKLLGITPKHQKKNFWEKKKTKEKKNNTKKKNHPKYIQELKFSLLS